MATGYVGPNGQWVTAVDQPNQSVAALSAGALRVLARPYTIIPIGDSRQPINATDAIGLNGSAVALNINRAPAWVAMGLGDAEVIASYGISGDVASNWNNPARTASKTISNLIAMRPDLVTVQFGINDLAASVSAATLTGYLKALATELMASGIRVVVEAIDPFVDPADASASSSAFATGTAAKLQALLDTNAAMKSWIATCANGMAAYADTYSAMLKTGTPYGDPAYYTNDGLGLHFNRRGASRKGLLVAAVARTLLPRRYSSHFSIGPLTSPNLVQADSLASGSTLFTSTETGTLTITTPTRGYTSDGVPYVEVTMTATALTSGTARGRLEIHASGHSGGSPTFPIFVGDRLQGTMSRLTIDNGNDGVQCSALNSWYVRHRLYSDTKFADVGGVVGSADGIGLDGVVDVARVFTPTFDTATASVGLSGPSAGAGYPLQTLVELTAINVPCRIRVYGPALRVVSTAQVAAITPGASPYTYTLTEQVGVNDADVIVGGGTVSAIAVGRGGGTGVTTGLTSGTFRLARGDFLTVTYTVAPTMTLVPR